MRDGALGVGSSLIYAPANFADTDELVALTAAAHEFGGTYISHPRSEAERYEQAIDEILELGRRPGAPVQIYHMNPAGKDNCDNSIPMLNHLPDPRENGIAPTPTTHPQTATPSRQDTLLQPPE